MTKKLKLIDKAHNFVGAIFCLYIICLFKMNKYSAEKSSSQFHRYDTKPENIFSTKKGSSSLRYIQLCNLFI